MSVRRGNLVKVPFITVLGLGAWRYNGIKSTGGETCVSQFRDLRPNHMARLNYDMLSCGYDESTVRRSPSQMAPPKTDI